MKLEDLEYILNHEWEEKKLSYCIDKYCVTEKIEYNHNEIYVSDGTLWEVHTAL